MRLVWMERGIKKLTKPSKIKPTKKVPRFERYNCSGKLRVDVKNDSNGDLEEIIILPKGGGCETNLKTIGSFITFCLECNIDTDAILEVLDKQKACTAPKDRADYKKGDIPREELGFGGCPRIIAQAIREKIKR